VTWFCPLLPLRIPVARDGAPLAPGRRPKAAEQQPSARALPKLFAHSQSLFDLLYAARAVGIWGLVRVCTGRPVRPGSHATDHDPLVRVLHLALRLCAELYAAPGLPSVNGRVVKLERRALGKMGVVKL